MRLLPLVHGIAESFIDLLFPPVCLACGVVTTANRAPVCSVCRSAMRYLRQEDELFLETFQRLSDGGAIVGLESRFVFEKGGPLQTLLHQLKYGGMTRIGLELGRELGAQYIARGIGEVAHLPVISSAVIRRKSTQSQTALNRHERVANVQGAFQVCSGELRWLQARSVLLVDDVITTGSTVRECARILVDAGVRAVVACSVALAAADI
jgi:predicted amidophosphoribosyltransferase